MKSRPPDKDTDWSWLADPRQTVTAIDPTMNSRGMCRTHLANLAIDGDLESMCQRCGDCCHLTLKLPRPDGPPVRILIPDLWCRFLRWNTDGTATCAVYDDRASQAPWCNGTEDGMVAGLYPARCGYVQRAGSWYTGTIRIPAELILHLLPEIEECLEGPLEPGLLRRFREKWQLRGR